MAALRKQLVEARNAAALAEARALKAKATTLENGAALLVARLDNVDAKAMQVGTLNPESLRNFD